MFVLQVAVGLYAFIQLHVISLLSFLNGATTFMGYLMPKLSLLKIGCNTI